MNLRLSLAGSAALLKGHPWIAADAQLSYRLPPPPGTLVKVQDSQGNFLGWALSEGPGVHPAFRMLSRLRRSDFGEGWWQEVVEQALARRRSLSFDDKAPRRLLDSEADAVPGLRCDAVHGVGFLSSSSPSLEPFLPLIEKALINQAWLRGLWRRLAGPGSVWGPWHRSPLAPLSPARCEAAEGRLRARLDLEADALAAAPPWPVEQRSWRAWAAAACPGRRVLALGHLDGETAAAQAARPERFEQIGAGFIQGLKGALAWRPDRLLVDVPVQSREHFGRFDAAKHSPRLLAALAGASAPDAELLLTSRHPSLAGAEAWQDAWLKSGAQARLVQVLAPGADCPELPGFAEGRRTRAFVFTLAPDAAQETAPETAPQNDPAA
jgi:hypothetical protein